MWKRVKMGPRQMRAVLVGVLAATGLALGGTGEAVDAERCGDVPRFSASNLKVKQVPCGKGRKLVKVWFYEMPNNAGKFDCNPSPEGEDGSEYRVRCADGRRVIRWLKERL